MSIARSTYESTLVEDAPRRVGPIEWRRSPLDAWSGRYPATRLADEHRPGRAGGGLDGDMDRLRGVALMDGSVGPLPAVVRQRGVVESVTAHVITVRCERGFAHAYVLIDEIGPDAREVLATRGRSDAPPTFERLRPGDEVMVTSWLEHEQEECAI